MSTIMRRLGVGALLLAGLWATQTTARAQFNLRPFPTTINPNNNNFVVTPGLTFDKYLAIVQAQARVASQIPPWVYGYNPYPPRTVVAPAYNPVPAFATPYANPYAPVGNPYAPAAVDPYGTSNPYTAMSNPYSPAYASPYAYTDPWGGVLRGEADIMRAYGTVITSQEQARLMREQALQARLDTQKKRFDLEMYIKANTPTFTEEQAKVAKTTLKRIQTNSTPYEIVNGAALNLLLDDVRRFPGRKVSMEPISISEDVLKQLNIIKSVGNLGILRDNGKFTWPLALQELLSSEQQKAVEAQAQALYKNSLKGKLDANVLRDLRMELEKIRDTLTRKILDIPTSQYLDAKRFLNDFDDARLALERGEGITQAEFHKWASGGHTVQELADYMVSRGLKFAPATAQDEASYRALHSAMVALDLAYNTQSGSVSEKE